MDHCVFPKRKIKNIVDFTIKMWMTSITISRQPILTSFFQIVLCKNYFILFKRFMNKTNISKDTKCDTKNIIHFKTLKLINLFVYLFN